MWHLRRSDFRAVISIVGVLLLSHEGFSKESSQHFPAGIPIADEELISQDGKKVRFYSDVIRGQKVVINFMFTACPMICPAMSAVSAKLVNDLAAAKDVSTKVVTITLDPRRDTPARLLKHREKFIKSENDHLNWTLYTGSPEAVSRVLASLGQKIQDPNNHEATYFVGDDSRGQWKTLRGNVSAKMLRAALTEVTMVNKQAADSDEKVFRNYFTDTIFTDQNGKKHRLFSDLMKGKKVLINFGFTKCKAICTPATKNMRVVQSKLGSRMGRDIVFITFTLDPEHDTPEVLKRFADKNQVSSGWYFLTGSRDDVQSVLKKIGGWKDLPDDHSGVLMYGDVDQGIWSKSSSMDSPRQIAFAIENLSNTL